MNFFKLLTLFIFIVGLNSINAQSYPKLVNYQAIASDLNGDPLVQQDIEVQISIIETSPNGTISFQEDHQATTNNSGLFTLLIGAGDPTANGTSNVFGGIGWETGVYYLNVKININDGNGFQDLGTQQLVAVPYAFQAKKAETVMYPTLSTLADLNNGTFIYYNEAGISNTFDANTYFDTQNSNISISGTGLSSSPYILSFNEVDGSTTNEIQDISLNGTDLAISSGSTIDLSGLSGSSLWNSGISGAGNSFIHNSTDLVGIGINPPSFPLHVNTSSFDRSAYFYNNTNTSNDTYGLYSGAWGLGSGDNYAGAFDAVGTSGTNYAIRAYASGGSTNWAGFFVGDVYIRGLLKIDDGTNPYTLPTSDGAPNQIMTTDGSGNLSWQNSAIDTDWNISNNDLFSGVTGNVGIGTTAPASKLHVDGEIRMTGATGGLYFLGQGGSFVYKTYVDAGGNYKIEYNNGTASFRFAGNNLYLGEGFVGGGPRLTVGNSGDGSTAVGNSWTVFSDKRFKMNISPIKNSLDLVMSLNGVTYDWKQSGNKDIGFIAQEVEEILPFIVHTNEKTDYKSMDYSRITPILVEAIQEQQKMIDNLKKKINELENKQKKNQSK